MLYKRNVGKWQNHLLSVFVCARHDRFNSDESQYGGEPSSLGSVQQNILSPYTTIKNRAVLHIASVCAQEIEVVASASEDGGSVVVNGMIYTLSG